jgi:hypothetical protein
VCLEDPQPVLGVELALQHDGLAHRDRARREAAGTRVVERPGGEIDVVGPIADVLHQRGTGPGVGGGAPERTLGFAGRARRVGHRGAALVDVGALHHVGRRSGDQRVDRGHPRGSVAVEDQQVDDLGNLVADPPEQFGELGVDVDGGGVAVVDDVRRLLVGEAVVQRDGGGADLARGAGQLEDARRVLPAPHDLVAGFHTESVEHVDELVRPVLELGEGGRADVVGARHARPVVDDRGLVRLCCGQRSQQIPHAQVVAPAGVTSGVRPQM